MGNPLVSVWMITYNHENYIAQALESVLMQKTNFDFEIVIGEDCSTDNTRNILQDFEIKYPKVIHAIYHEKNVGALSNAYEFALPKCRGKYIACLEGDDYWTDPLKLQKQVDIMESNAEYSFCFHNAITYYVDRNAKEDFNRNLKSKIYKTKDLLSKRWFIPTASLLIRKVMMPEPFPKWFYNVCQGDYALELLLSTKGDFFYINEKMSVYQKNSINSLSLTGPKGKESLKKQLLLLTNFKKNNANKNIFANNYAIAKVRYNFLKVFIYDSFPFVVTLKDKILHGK